MITVPGGNCARASAAEAAASPVRLALLPYRKGKLVHRNGSSPQAPSKNSTQPSLMAGVSHSGIAGSGRIGARTDIRSASAKSAAARVSLRRSRYRNS
jgi:hypothetical protein